MDWAARRFVGSEERGESMMFSLVLGGSVVCDAHLAAMGVGWSTVLVWPGKWRIFTCLLLSRTLVTV